MKDDDGAQRKGKQEKKEWSGAVGYLCFCTEHGIRHTVKQEKKEWSGVVGR